MRGEKEKRDGDSGERWLWGDLGDWDVFGVPVKVYVYMDIRGVLLWLS